MLRPGETLRLVRRSASAVVHAVEGASPAFLFMVDAAPLQRKLGIYAEFAASE